MASMPFAVTPAGNESAMLTGEDEPSTLASPTFVATTTILPFLSSSKTVGRALEVTLHHGDSACASAGPTSVASAQPTLAVSTPLPIERTAITFYPSY
jgi:hypothetical protein